MSEYGFKTVDAAKTIFSYESDAQSLLVATIVDDSIVAYSHDSTLERWYDFLRSKVPITVQPLDTIAGMRVRCCSDGTITVDQEEYIVSKAQQFKCTAGSEKIFCPMGPTFQVGPKPEIIDTARVEMARKIVGSCIWATLTRQDIKFSCSRLASVVTCPTLRDIAGMRRILQFLYHTRSTKLVFSPGSWTASNGVVYGGLELVGFVDASFAQSEGRKSQTGFCLMLSGASVLSKSGKQSQVTDSTGYAETIALHEASNWVIVTRRQLGDMFAPQLSPTVLLEDSKACKAFADNGPGPRSLHWDVKYRYVHELQTRKIVQVEPVDTKLQIADIFTKPLEEPEYLRLAAHLLGGPIVFSK